MDRDEVEDMVHASLGRHLRVTCVLGLLFLAVGFVLGNYVAAQHSRQLADRMSDRTGVLTAQIDEKISQLQSRLANELAQVRALATASRAGLGSSSDVAPEPLLVGPDTRHDDLLHETRRLARATEDLRRSLIARCIEENEQEKARILQELQPYLDRKMTIRAAEVSEAVNRLVDHQVAQLKTLARVEIPPTPAADLTYRAHDEISHVSGESDPAHCPAPVQNPLVPVAEVPAPEIQEPVALMPMPSKTLARMPVQAEPTVARKTAKVGDQSQFFTAPRKPRVFIPARKPLEVSSAEDTVVR